jgi:tetratricopeptide (TPR) repeat protein
MRVGIGILAAALIAPNLGAQDGAIREALTAAADARRRGQFADAEREGLAAIEAAEKFTPAGELLHETLADLATTYYYQRKYSDAGNVFRRAVEIAGKSGLNGHAVSDRAVERDWHFLGRIANLERKPAEALAAFQQALTVMEKMIGPNDPELSDLLLEMAGTHRTLQKFDEAEQLLRRALKILESLKEEDNRLRTALVMMRLASVLQILARHEDAEKYYRAALAIREEVSAPSHPAVADALNELGDFLRLRGRTAEAEPLLRRALAIVDAMSVPDQYLLSNVLNNLGLAVEYLGKLDEAESLLLRGLDTAERDNGSESATVSRRLSNLAGLYARQNRLAEAEKMALRSVAIREKIFGLEDLNLISELYVLAQIYTRQKRYTEANPLFKRVLSIREKLLPPGHPEVIEAYLRLADNLRDQELYYEAEPLYQKALNLAEKTYGPKHLQTAVPLLAAAVFYTAAGRLTEAEPLHRRSLEIREEQWAASPEKLNSSWNNLAVFLRMKGSYREAVEVLEKSLTVPEVAPTGNAIRLTNLADLYRRQGRYAKAEALIVKTIDLDDGLGATVNRLRQLALLDYAHKRYSQASGEIQQALSMVVKTGPATLHPVLLQDAGNIRRDSGQYPEAERFYLEAMALLEKKAVELPDLGSLLDDMAVLALHRNRLLEAEPLLLRSRRLLERSVGTESALTGICYEHLAVLYGEQKRFANAEAWFKRALEIQERTIGADAPALAPLLTEFAQTLRAVGRAGEAAPLEIRANTLQAASTQESINAARR